MSSFNGIGTLSNALRAFQRELDVTGQNIANVETQGYSRQKVDLSSNFTSGFPFPTGNGVSVASVNRIRDQFLDARKSEVNADLGRANAQSEGLSKVDGIIMEPSTNGVSDALGKFFDSWSALSGNPSQLSLKSDVLTAGQTLVTRIRGAYDSLQGLKSESEARVGDAIGRVNELGKSIADLNNQIRRSAVVPNELLDKRDAAITELASLVDVKTATLNDGSVTVSINQLTLVSGSDYKEMPTSPIDAATGTIGSGDQRISIRSGAIRGEFDAQSTISGYQSQLDDLANAIRDAVNGIHQTNPTGNAFFTGSGAKGLDLDASVKGQPANVATGTTTAGGDGSIALQLSRMRSQGITSLGGRTLGDSYSNLVATVGRDTKAAKETVGIQSALSAQVDGQIQSVSGVSLDDEMANMMRFQRTYQAAAKALNTFDSTFDDLLGILR